MCLRVFRPVHPSLAATSSASIFLLIKIETMNPEDRALLVKKLHESRDALLEAIAQVSETQAAFKPTPDCWSIGEVMEHLAVTEHGMYRLISAHYEQLEGPAKIGREYEILETRGIDRSRKFTAPERVQPKGRYPSLAAALAQFQSNRETTIRYIETCADDLRLRATNHPAGRMTCLECLAVLITHPLRHLAQIREVQQHSGYPPR